MAEDQQTERWTITRTDKLAAVTGPEARNLEVVPAQAAERLAEAGQEAYDSIYELIPPPSIRTRTEQDIVAQLKTLRTAVASFRQGSS